MAVRLPGLQVGRSLPSGRFLVFIYVIGWINRNWTRYLPASAILPQPTLLPRAVRVNLIIIIIIKCTKNRNFNCSIYIYIYTYICAYFANVRYLLRSLIVPLSNIKQISQIIYSEVELTLSEFPINRITATKEHVRRTNSLLDSFKLSAWKFEFLIIFYNFSWLICFKNFRFCYYNNTVQYIVIRLCFFSVENNLIKLSELYIIRSNVFTNHFG
jgi:hypothetical protein